MTEHVLNIARIHLYDDKYFVSFIREPHTQRKYFHKKKKNSLTSLTFHQSSYDTEICACECEQKRERENEIEKQLSYDKIDVVRNIERQNRRRQFFDI